MKWYWSELTCLILIQIYCSVCFILSHKLPNTSEGSCISLHDAIHIKPVNTESIYLALRRSHASYEHLRARMKYPMYCAKNPGFKWPPITLQKNLGFKWPPITLHVLGDVFSWHSVFLASHCASTVVAVVVVDVQMILHKLSEILSIHSSVLHDVMVQYDTTDITISITLTLLGSWQFVPIWSAWMVQFTQLPFQFRLINPCPRFCLRLQHGTKICQIHCGTIQGWG
jgi:hypothetical protein